MNSVDRLQKEIMAEFGSSVVQERYAKLAEAGFWQSEQYLIKKYFAPGSSVLEIGCGSGRTVLPMHKMGYKITGVDLTPEMIDIARKVSESQGQNIPYFVGDAKKVEFENESFDNAFFGNNGWTQIPGRINRQTALKEVCRILKPGGYYIFTAGRRYYDRYYLPFWIRQALKVFILKPLGFKMDELEFGDMFYNRKHNGKRLKQRQFMHIGSVSEVQKQIKQSGFELIESMAMSDLSQVDAEKMHGSLFPTDNARKSPVFYVCRKLL